MASDFVETPVDGLVRYCYLMTSIGNTYLESMQLQDESIYSKGRSKLLAPGHSWSQYRDLKVSNDNESKAFVVAFPVLKGGVEAPGLGEVTDTDTATIKIIEPLLIAANIRTNEIASVIDLDSDGVVSVRFLDAFDR